MNRDTIVKSMKEPVGRLRVAVIGSGVAGLVAARQLHDAHQVTVFEQQDYLGGHAHTVVVQDGERTLNLDTGFIVFNRQNYPQFSRMLDKLNIASQPSEMSFGVSCQKCDIEYSSRGLKGLFARRRHALSPHFYRMIIDIVRFNRWACQKTGPGIPATQTIGDLRKDRLFSDDFFRHYLMPMTGAVWSSTGADVDEMPLSFLLTFFQNHGLLQTHGHPKWRTVTGGSHRYIESLSKPFIDRVRLKTPVLTVRRHPNNVEVRTNDGWEQFDKVILATHTDQTLRLLNDASHEERLALGAIAYRRNEAVLHTDADVLATVEPARASWNCHIDRCVDRDAPLRMTYYLNRLQRLDTTTPYLVTLNDDGRVNSNRVLARMVYAHPMYTSDSLSARRTLQQLNGQRNTAFCGAYMGNGFHEDGVQSGLAAAQLVSTKREST